MPRVCTYCSDSLCFFWVCCFGTLCTSLCNQACISHQNIHPVYFKISRNFSVPLPSPPPGQLLASASWFIASHLSGLFLLPGHLPSSPSPAQDPPAQLCLCMGPVSPHQQHHVGARDCSGLSPRWLCCSRSSAHDVLAPFGEGRAKPKPRSAQPRPRCPAGCVAAGSVPVHLRLVQLLYMGKTCCCIRLM